MNKKTYTCKQCGDQLKGQRRKFCDQHCHDLWSRDQLKMDFGTGWGFSHPSRFGEDASFESLYVPYNVLQEAKNISDLTNEKNIVEDPETVNIAMRSLQRNTPNYVLSRKQLNHQRWKKQQIKEKGYWVGISIGHNRERQKK